MARRPQLWHFPYVKKGKQNVKLVLRCSAAFSKWATILLCTGVLVQWFWNTKMLKARTLAPVRPSRPRMCLMYYKIYPRVSEDHPDRSWMLQMGSLSPLSTTCTSRLSSFWNGRRS